MPYIQQLLPASRIAAIKQHGRSDTFKQKRAQAVADIQSYAKHPGINQEEPPAVWVSYGKDSMALWLLCEEAGITYEPCFIDNALELPQHYDVIDEFHRWLDTPAATTYATQYVGIEYLAGALHEARLTRKEKMEKAGARGKPLKPKPPINFFEPQEAYGIFYYDVIGQFHWEHIGENPNTVHLWATRGAEGMGRYWELAKNGKLFQPAHTHGKNQVPTWRALPIGDWQELDIWAYLLLWDCPVSPVYGMNAITQRGAGRNYWPRTLWYCDPHIFSSTFAKWLHTYAPACLYDVLDRFPEVKAKFSKKNAG